MSAFYEHVQPPRELGCIECVETRTVCGAKEHFFRATTTLLLDDRAWRRLPATIRHDIAADLIQTIRGEDGIPVTTAILGFEADRAERYPPESARARAKTASSIGSVSRPVNVFCWLGW